jgi:dTDP-glucose 4,6-dehydratase
MSQRITVIGSNSFSGASFSAYALKNGLDVIGISRSLEPHRVFLPYRWCDAEEQNRFSFHRLDLNRDTEAIVELVRKNECEYVYNFAAQSMVAESWQNPEQWFQTNVVANVRLHDMLRSCESLKKYVHVSTPEVYGSCQGLVPESTNYNPSTPYAVSRAAADMHLMSFYKAYGFPVAFTRAANVYGPGQQLYRIIPRTILFFLLGKKLQLHGGGQSVRSFIHIRDVADGTLRVAENAPAGEIYHLSTPKNISIHDLVMMIADQMGVPFEDHVEVVGERLGKDSAYLLDSAKARSTLGWSDTIALEQGIEESISWVRDNIDVIRTQPFDYIHKQ